MKKTLNVLFVAFFILSILSMIMGHQSFATQNPQTDPSQKDSSSPYEILKDVFGPLLVQTNLAITKDIEETKVRIKAESDLKVQANEVRDLLLRMTGKMASYTAINFNLYVILMDGEPGLFPYFLMGSHKKAPSNVAWFEFLKDPTNAPEFSDPSKVLDKISTKFAMITEATEASAKYLLDAIGDAADKPKSDDPPSHPHARPFPQFVEPGSKIKYILQKIKDQHVRI